MDWIQILLAIVLIAMMVRLYPSIKQASQNSKPATSDDWMSFIKPMALVILFVVALIVLSR